MDLRPAAVFLLALGSVSAQVIPPSPLAPPAATTQDPDKPKPTPAQELARLQAERDRLQREIEFVQARGKSQQQFLAEKLRGARPAIRSIDAGTNRPAAAPAPTPMAPKMARAATKEEWADFGADTMIVVNGRRISQAAFDELMAWLAQSPGSGDETARAQRATFELIRIEAIASQFPDSEAQGRIAEVEAQLAAGRSMAELAQSVGVVGGGRPDGTLDVTRNSPFGPRLEMIAFRTAPGSRAQPFRNTQGFVLLQVDAIEKGETPEQDRIKATAVQIPYSSDPAAVHKAHLAVNTGQIDILVRDEKILTMLPSLFYRPASLTPQPVLSPDQLRSQIQQLEGDLKNLEQMEGDDAKRKADAIRRHLETLREQLKITMSMIDVGDEEPPARKPEPPKKDAPR
jgi:hypothetical protein